MTLHLSVFRLNPASRLHWNAWDDDYVVFDEASGHTHHMDAVRAYVLELLGESVKPRQELLNALSQFPTLVEQPDLQGMLDAMLDEFCTHGLVEVVAL